MVDLVDRLELQNLIVTGLRRMGAAAGVYETLSLTEEQKMTAAEALAERLLEKHTCNVQMGCVSLLARLYLNERYGLKLHVGSSACDAVTTKAYVQPDGAVFPCQDVANQLAAQENRGPVDSSFTSSSEHNAAIAESVRGLAVFASYTPCSTCAALGKLCTPCPLPGLRGPGHPVHDACILAMRRAKKYGVDLSRGIDEAYQRYLGERIVDSPDFRREFFSRSASAHSSRTETTEEGADYASFQQQALTELSQLLLKASEEQSASLTASSRTPRATRKHAHEHKTTGARHAIQTSKNRAARPR